MIATVFNNELSVMLHTYFTMMMISICKIGDVDFYEKIDEILTSVTLKVETILNVLNLMEINCTIEDPNFTERLRWVKIFHQGFTGKLNWVKYLQTIILRDNRNKKSEYSRLHNLLSDYMKLCMMFIDLHMKIVTIKFTEDHAQNVFKYLLEQNSSLISLKDINSFIKNNNRDSMFDFITSEYIESSRGDIQVKVIASIWLRYK